MPTSSGFFPNEDSITRLIGAVLLEQNDEYQLQRHSIQLKGLTALAAPQLEEVPQLQITPNAPDRCGPGPHPKLHHVDGRDPSRIWLQASDGLRHSGWI